MMRVLLAVDDSAHSRDAVGLVLDRAWPYQTAFHLVSVVENADSVHENGRAAGLLDAAREAIQARFAESDVTGELLCGDPARAILASQNLLRPDLTVVGTRGHTGLKRLVLGSVSQSVLINGEGAVLIARAGRKRGPVLRILAAVDALPHSGAVIEWLKLFPLLVATEIKFLTVVRGASEKYSDGIGALHEAAQPGLADRDTTQAQSILAGLCASHGFAGGDRRLSFIARRGDAIDEILAECSSWNPDLIVTGSRGHRGVTKLIEGSISQEIVLRAACPVEVVKRIK